MQSVLTCAWKEFDSYVFFYNRDRVIWENGVFFCLHVISSAKVFAKQWNVQNVSIANVCAVAVGNGF